MNVPNKENIVVDKQNRKKKSGCACCFSLGSKKNLNYQVKNQPPPQQAQPVQPNFERNVGVNQQNLNVLQPRRLSHMSNRPENNEIIQDEPQNPQNPGKPKRKIPISQFIQSAFIGKEKCLQIKCVSERPKDKHQRKIYKYLCPICFMYFNEMLNCVKCDNYICMHCARGLIKQELKSTRNVNPPPEEIHIKCPHCQAQSETQKHLFVDVDKKKPVKLYTDSPTGTVLMTNDFGGHEEFKISVSRFSLRPPLKDLRSESKQKMGIVIQYPVVKTPLNNEIKMNSSQGSFFGQFINRAHLEVLKKEDLEDQFLAKKLVDIICSPRAHQRSSKLQMAQQDQPFGGYNSNRSAGQIMGNTQRSAMPFQVQANLRKYAESTHSKQPPMINTYMKEHFWSLEFMRKLQGDINSRKSNNSKTFVPGQSRTFEDLPLYRPNIFFNNFANEDQVINISPAKSNKSTEGVRLRTKPPLPGRQILSLSAINNDLQGGHNMNQLSAKSISNKTKSKYQMEFYKGQQLNSPQILVLSQRDGASVFMSSQKSEFKDDEIFHPNQIGGSPNKDGKDRNDVNKYKSPNKTTIGQPFISAKENPFMIFTEGVVKIGELLQNQRQVHQKYVQEDQKEENNEFVEFNDTMLQIYINHNINKENKLNTNEEDDDLLYSNCDLDEEADEGNIQYEKIKAGVNRERSFFKEKKLGQGKKNAVLSESSDEFERADKSNQIVSPAFNEDIDTHQLLFEDEFIRSNKKAQKSVRNQMKSDDIINPKKNIDFGPIDGGISDVIKQAAQQNSKQKKYEYIGGMNEDLSSNGGEIRSSVRRKIEESNRITIIKADNIQFDDDDFYDPFEKAYQNKI